MFGIRNSNVRRGTRRTSDKAEIEMKPLRIATDLCCKTEEHTEQVAESFNEFLTSQSKTVV